MEVIEIKGKRLLEKLAKKTGKTVEEIEELYEQLKSQMMGQPEKVVYNALISKLRREVVPSPMRRQTQSRIATLIGFKVGDCGLMDWADILRRKAERVKNELGFDYALQQGLINEEGQPVDTRAFVFGRSNPHYGEPIPENASWCSRRIYLLAKEAEDDKFRLAHLQTEDTRLAKAWGDLPFYTWVTFPAIVRVKDEHSFMLRGSTAKSTRTLFKQVKHDEDIYKVYSSYFKPRLTPIKHVEKHYEALKDAWDRWIVVYGMVEYLGYEREWGRMGNLVDPEYGLESEAAVRFRIPANSTIKIDFGVYSEVYVFGKTRRSKYRDPETGELVPGDVIIDAWGIMPNPEVKTEPEMEVEIEEDIEGFIPLEEE